MTMHVFQKKKEFLLRKTFKDVRGLEIMFMLVTIPKLYQASCQTDENRIKSGSNLTVADTRVAEPSKAEGLGIKLSVCDV